MRIIGNEKGLNIGFLSGKSTLVATSGAEVLAGGPQSYSSRTYLQQQQQQRQRQQQQQQPRHAAAAASCRSNKRQKAPTSRSVVYLVRCSAPAGISSLIFSFSSSFATKQYNNKWNEKISQSSSCFKFSPAKPTWHPVVFVSLSILPRKSHKRQKEPYALGAVAEWVLVTRCSCVSRVGCRTASGIVSDFSWCQKLQQQSYNKRFSCFGVATRGTHKNK